MLTHPVQFIFPWTQKEIVESRPPLGENCLEFRACRGYLKLSEKMLTSLKLRLGGKQPWLLAHEDLQRRYLPSCLHITPVSLSTVVFYFELVRLYPPFPLPVSER